MNEQKKEARVRCQARVHYFLRPDLHLTASRLPLRESYFIRRIVTLRTQPSPEGVSERVTISTTKACVVLCHAFSADAFSEWWRRVATGGTLAGTATRTRAVHVASRLRTTQDAAAARWGKCKPAAWKSTNGGSESENGQAAVERNLGNHMQRFKRKRYVARTCATRRQGRRAGCRGCRA